MIERANHTIQTMLKIYLDPENCSTWDDRLPFIQLAYNTSQHTATGLTPFYVLFGREARLPLQLMCPAPDAAADPCSPTQYVLDLQCRLQGAYQFVRTHLNVAQRRAKEVYDRTASSSALPVGQLVWLYRHPPAGTSPKPFRFWGGPW